MITELMSFANIMMSALRKGKHIIFEYNDKVRKALPIKIESENKVRLLEENKPKTFFLNKINNPMISE